MAQGRVGVVAELVEVEEILAERIGCGLILLVRQGEPLATFSFWWFLPLSGIELETRKDETRL